MAHTKRASFPHICWKFQTFCCSSCRVCRLNMMECQRTSSRLQTPGRLTFPVRHVLLRWGPWWHRSSLDPIKAPTWLLTAFICSQNSRIVFGNVNSHRMKKRRGFCRSGSGCCRRISSVTTSPKLFGVGRRSWGGMVTISNQDILVRKPNEWGTCLFSFYLTIFNDPWVKQKEALLFGTPV